MQQKEQSGSRVTSIVSSSQIRLKSVGNYGSPVQGATGLLARFGVPPQRDTTSGRLISLPPRENDRHYFSEMMTFEFPAIPNLSTQPIRIVQDGSARWKILVGLVAILVISLICIGIFSAYLVGPALIPYVHMFVG